ncbi:unnamed protein product [Caenorhabditis sp. 36 PRJEB53466]|nr:unnamed protein product [Caenorhabditis sp. 36 PRJEB53466]
MADKINMSLDDIIKHNQKDKKKNNGNSQKPGTSNKNTGNKNGAGAKKARVGAGRRAPPAKNARVVLANKVLKKSKLIARRANAGAGAQRRVIGARGRPAAAAGLNTVATKKLVNKLVKNALRKRTNITTAQVVRKRGGVAASTLAARRNLAVRRNVIAPPVRTVIQRPTVVRAPVRTVVQHVQPAPVRVVREIITAPQIDTRVIRRGPPPQSRRNRQPQQQRTVVVQQVQQGRRFRPNNNNRRNDRPTVIRRQVVQQAPRRAQVARPQYEQVVQRVVQRVPHQQQQQGRNVRFVNSGNRPIQRKTVVQQAPRYQPVQYVTEHFVPSRGRGFRAF